MLLIFAGAHLVPYVHLLEKHILISKVLESELSLSSELPDVCFQSPCSSQSPNLLSLYYVCLY